MKWVNLFSSGQGSQRQFLLQVGVDPAYYHDRIPNCLKKGTAVQLYPLLFQVGVDIRQWGAHAGSNLMKNGKQEISSGLVDDEDEDIGVVDDDVLVALNFDALRKVDDCPVFSSVSQSSSSFDLWLIGFIDECICTRHKPPKYSSGQGTGNDDNGFFAETRCCCT